MGNQMIENAPLRAMERIEVGEANNEIMGIYNRDESSTLQLRLDVYGNVIVVPATGSSGGSDTPTFKGFGQLRTLTILETNNEDDGIATIFVYGQTSNVQVMLDEQGNLCPVPTCQ